MRNKTNTSLYCCKTTPPAGQARSREESKDGNAASQSKFWTWFGSARSGWSRISIPVSNGHKQSAKRPFLPDCIVIQDGLPLAMSEARPPGAQGYPGLRTRHSVVALRIGEHEPLIHVHPRPLRRDRLVRIHETSHLSVARTIAKPPAKRRRGSSTVDHIHSIPPL